MFADHESTVHSLHICEVKRLVREYKKREVWRDKILKKTIKLIVIQVYIAHRNNRKLIRIKPSHSGSSPTRMKWTKAQRLDSRVLAIPL